MELSETERDSLAHFAALAYPGSLGTGALSALLTAETGPGLVDRFARQDPGFPPERLPRSDGPLAEEDLRSLGWQPSLHHPTIVACVVVGRALLPGLGTIRQLVFMARSRRSVAEQRLQRRAYALLQDLQGQAGQAPEAGRADILALLARYLSDPELIQGLPWSPAALGRFCRLDDDRSLHYETWSLRAACSWIAQALDAGEGSAWSSDDRATAISLYNRQRTYESAAGAEAERIPDLDHSLRALLSRSAIGELFDFVFDAEARFRGHWPPATYEFAIEEIGRRSIDRVATAREYLRRAFAYGSSDPHEAGERLILAVGEDQLGRLALELLDAGLYKHRADTWLGRRGTQIVDDAVTRAFKAEPPPDNCAALVPCLGSGAVATLIWGLGQEDVRATASAEGLARLEKEAVPQLIAASLGDDSTLAVRALELLTTFEPAGLRDHFVSLLARESGRLRELALEGLRGFARHARWTTGNTGLGDILRRAFDSSSLEEKKLILEILPECLDRSSDFHWATQVPIEEHYASALTDCLAFVLSRVLWRMSHLSAEQMDELIARLLPEIEANPHIFERWKKLTIDAKGLSRLLLEYLDFRGEDRPALRRTLRDVPEPVFAGGVSTPSREEARPVSLEANTCLSVLAPTSVRAGEHFVIEAAIYAKSLRSELLFLSSLEKPRIFTSTGRTPPRGATVTVSVQVQGIEVQEGAADLVWDGKLAVANFACSAPPGAVDGSHPGRARFSVDGLTIATTHFVVTIARETGPRAEVNAPIRMIRTAFASYATSDRRAVLARIQGIQKVAPFVDFFLDVISLRSGSDWRANIRREILSRDVLFLFWSSAASRSRFVDWEWRTALTERGLEYIDPVPIETPQVAPPPKELSSLHFNDWTLAITADS